MLATLGCEDGIVCVSASQSQLMTFKLYVSLWWMCECKCRVWTVWKLEGGREKEYCYVGVELSAGSMCRQLIHVCRRMSSCVILTSTLSYQYWCQVIFVYMWIFGKLLLACDVVCLFVGSPYFHFLPCRLFLVVASCRTKKLLTSACDCKFFIMVTGTFQNSQPKCLLFARILKYHIVEKIIEPFSVIKIVRIHDTICSIMYNDLFHSHKNFPRIQLRLYEWFMIIVEKG